VAISMALLLAHWDCAVLLVVHMLPLELSEIFFAMTKRLLDREGEVFGLLVWATHSPRAAWQILHVRTIRVSSSAQVQRVCAI